MSGFVLKIIACITMLLDHTQAIFDIPKMDFLRAIGRMAFPIYVFFVAEGCRHTKNIWKYLFRLALFALISEIVFDMAFSYVRMPPRVPLKAIDFTWGTNVFYTLFFGAAANCVYEKFLRKKNAAIVFLPFILTVTTYFLFFTVSSDFLRLLLIIGYLRLCVGGFLALAKFLPDKPDNEQDNSVMLAILPAFAMILAAGVLDSDYGTYGALFIFLTYVIGKGKKIPSAITVGACFLFLYGNNILLSYTSIMFWFYILIVLLAVGCLVLYNGKRGPKLKWAFYAFY
ncbi:MAG: conjugal transfer protein TraX, partial [Clostridiales bacterium]|nr:conjugal transfer protein TraX [Clostridiales bacterium]